MSEINWREPTLWDKLQLSKSEAAKKFQELNEQQLIPTKLKTLDQELRNALVETIQNAQSHLYEETDKPAEYDIDLYTGLALYNLLNIKFNFNERLAAQDDFWRYLSICIIPDLVYKRFGLTPTRYYEHPRRVWLKSLWWYIHLSWQGSQEKTLKILEPNTTDTIVQLIERTGLNGYRIEVTRKLMSEYFYSYENIPSTQRTALFRRVQKLSTARTKIIEPSLIYGGTDAYVKGLFEYFVKPNRTKN